MQQSTDVALRMDAMPDSNMTAHKIAQARRRVMAVPTYLDRHRTPSTPADLSNHQTDWELPTLSLSAVFPTGRIAGSKARKSVSSVEECAGMSW